MASATVAAAVDVGYGYTKAVLASTARRTVFPSAVAPDISGAALSTAFGHRPGTGSARITIDGRTTTWLFGDHALSGGGTRSWNPTAAKRDDYATLVLTALGRLDVAGEVDLTVGLPINAYKNPAERDAITRAISGTSASVSVEGRPETHVAIRTVRVLPQSLGALMHLLPHGMPTRSSMIGIVDVGYRTCDYLLCSRKGTTPYPDANRSGSLPMGTSLLMDALRQYVLANSSVTTPPSDAILESALERDGVLPVNRRPMPLLGAYQDACRALAATIDTQIRRAWDDALPFLDSVILTGGGGQALVSHTSLPGATLGSDPVWANALGFAGL